MTETSVVGGYVRHRDRMVQESVFQDLRDTLIAFNWLEGTTSRPVRPFGSEDWLPVTTTAGQTLPLLEGYPIMLIDYFPEAEDGAAIDDPTTTKTAFNTLALDNGTRVDSVPRELGNRTAEDVLYRFSMAFYAYSDAVAQAIMGDLADRYRGRAIRPDFIELWNYNATPEELVVRMSVEGFEFTSAAEQEGVPHEVRLYFAELLVEDQVD